MTSKLTSPAKSRVARFVIDSLHTRSVVPGAEMTIVISDHMVGIDCGVIVPSIRHQVHFVQAVIRIGATCQVSVDMASPQIRVQITCTNLILSIYRAPRLQ